MEIYKNEYSHYSVDDFLQLDNKLFPMLGDGEKQGEHLKVLFSLTHSKKDANKLCTRKAYQFLLAHKEDDVDEHFILSLAACLEGEGKGQWKCRNSYFDDGKTFYVTCSAEKTPEEMKRLLCDFSFLNHPKKEEFERIFEFVLRFVCIHPFLDGNGRLSSLLLMAFLYKAGLRSALYLPIDALMNGLYGGLTSLEIRKASGCFYGMKPFDLTSYIPYMKGLLGKSYEAMLLALE